MTQGGFFEQRRSSPASLAIVLTLHGAAITALALTKMEFVVAPPRPPIEVELIDESVDPPPAPSEPVEPRASPRQPVIAPVPPIVPALQRDPLTLRPNDEVVIPDPRPLEPVILEPADPPKADPVRVEASIDPRSELLPPYPAAEQRAGREGSVTVGLRIGSDGRVREVEKVRAASDAFYRATERQALRNWRFKPATVDGRPVESRSVMTVRFVLAEA